MKSAVVGCPEAETHAQCCEALRSTVVGELVVEPETRRNLFRLQPFATPVNQGLMTKVPRSLPGRALAANWLQRCAGPARATSGCDGRQSSASRASCRASSSQAASSSACPKPRTARCVARLHIFHRIEGRRRQVHRFNLRAGVRQMRGWPRGGWGGL